MKSTKKSLDFKNVLVYLAMVALVAIIALPPLFRVLFKEKKESAVAAPKGEALALICKKQVTLETVSYLATVTSNYIDSKLQKVTISYRRTGELTEALQNNAVEQEMALLHQSQIFDEEVDATTYKYVLTKAKYEQNKDHPTVVSYFKNALDQQLSLTSNGYSCQELTS